MEVSLFTKNKETWTRFKISVNELELEDYRDIKSIAFILGEPIKKSSRYYYWEIKGDYVNVRPRMKVND